MPTHIHTPLMYSKALSTLLQDKHDMLKLYRPVRHGGSSKKNTLTSPGCPVLGELSSKHIKLVQLHTI